MNNSQRKILHAIVAALLLGTLAFLFVRTEQGGFERRHEALQRLGDLRDIDLRWDRDAEALRSEARAILPPTDRGTQALRILRELRMAAAGLDSPALVQALPEIERSLTAKAAALKEARDRHREVVSAREAFERSAVTFDEALDTARLRDPRQAESLDSARRDLHATRAALHLQAADREPVRLDHEKTLAGFAALPPSGDAVKAGADAFTRTARALAQALRAEAQAHEALTSLPGGLRLDGTARSLAVEITTALATQERYRTYLFAYAAALLVLVALLAARVIAAHAALRAANEGLEKRVAERTRELSLAMERLKESEAQLVQTEKMSSLGQMVAGVAHEINTPLAYVKNSVANGRDRLPELREVVALSERMLQLLQSEAPNAADLDETFAALSGRLGRLRSQQVLEDLETLSRDGLHGIEQISELVTNLRNFSRVDRSRVASFNVNEGVNQTLLIARTQLRKVTIEKHLGEIPSITCSPSQVNQVLLNLITNAAYAIDKPNGQVTVSTRRVGRDAIAIEVKDNGKGIDPAVLPKIFDPFFTTKEIGKGTGLGLSIAYKIVQQHGGHIDVRSERGAGATFTVTLPVEPPDSLMAEQAAEAAQA